MKRLIPLSLLMVSLTAISFAQTTPPPFPFTFYIHDSTGVLPDTPLPAIYQFAATPVGSSSGLLLKMTNTSGAPAFLGEVAVTVGSTSTVQNTNFTVNNLVASTIVEANGSFVFRLNFNPGVTGQMTAYMQATYQVQQSGCNFTSNIPATQCPSGLHVISTLTGTATAPQLVLNYQSSTGNTLMQPNSTSPLSFGNVSTSAFSTITFTLSNESTVDINLPSVTIPPPTIYTASPFFLDLSKLPATLGAGESANFTVTFAPGQVGFNQGTLVVGPNSYLIEGAGVVVSDIDALEISYVDSTGVRSLPQAATPISFGQVVAGASGSNVLSFTVTNPPVSYNAVSLSNISVSGAGFSIGAISGASAFPASLMPGGSVTFQVTFVPIGSGNYSGTLKIGSRVFSLAGLATGSAVPAFTLAVNPSPLASQQQATVAVQFSTPPAVDIIGAITMAFKPSVKNVTDDPAVLFLATSGRTLNLKAAAGSQSATYNGQSAFNFQTGTTAGTIQFTVAFPDTPAYTQSFTITPATPQITSASAVRSNPNLVVTVTGYDNTYSAGMLSFTFYDTSGKEITPVSVDATSDFQQLFFNNNTGGGAFSVQATFPVTGNVMDVGSVSLTASNSVGQASSTQTF